MRIKDNFHKHFKNMIVVGLIVASFLITSIMVPISGENVSGALSFRKTTTITITLSSTDFEVGKNVHADGVLLGKTGIAGARIALKVTLPNGQVSYPIQGSRTYTTTGGHFDMDYVPTMAGKHTFTATFSGTLYYLKSTGSISFNAVENVAPILPVQSTSSMTLTLLSTSVETGKNMHADGQLKGEVGIPDAAVNLMVTLPDGTTTYPSQGSQVMTDGNGLFYIDFISTIPGTHRYTATYSGDADYTESSSNISFEVNSPITTVPSAPTITSAIPGDGQITLAWTAPDNNGGLPIIGYKVYRGTTPGGEILLTTIGNVLIYTDTGLENGIMYYYKLTAVNWNGWSVLSNEISATPTSNEAVNITTSITLESESNIEIGSTCNISGRLRTESGTAITGASISIMVENPDGSKTSPSTVTTDSNGEFSYTVTPSIIGIHSVSATYNGDGSYVATSSNMSFVATAPEIVPTITYDYIVSNNVVKDSVGAVSYTGSDMSAALNWAVSKAYKVVYVPSGTYILPNKVNAFANGVTLMGDGVDKTVFKFTNLVFVDYPQDPNSGFHTLNVNDVMLKQFTVTGAGGIQFRVTSGTCSGNTAQDILVRDTANVMYHAFGVVVSNGAVMDNTKFIRCIAFNVGGDGFNLWGDVQRWTYDTRIDGGWIKNTYMEDCKALYSSYTQRVWTWAVGYDLCEWCNTENTYLLRCEASYSWESGFYVEQWGYCKNTKLVDCVANYNGQKYSDPRDAWNGYGYLYYPGDSDVTLINCTGIGNFAGFFGYNQNYDFTLPAYTYMVQGERMGVGNRVVDGTGAVVYSTSVTGPAGLREVLQWAVSHPNANVLIPGGYGTLLISGKVYLASGVTLYGNDAICGVQGRTTELVFTGTGDGIVIENVDNTRVWLLQITNGNIVWRATGGDIMVGNEAKGLTIYHTASGYAAAVEVYCGSGSTIDGLEMVDVRVLESRTDGYKFYGDGFATNGWIKNLSMTLCKADACGPLTPIDDQGMGYIFGDGVNMQNAYLSLCNASNNGCSGFYFTPGGSMTSMTLQDCVSSYNGQSGDVDNCSGYMLNGHTIGMINCVGTGNGGLLLIP